MCVVIMVQANYCEKRMVFWMSTDSEPTSVPPELLSMYYELLLTIPAAKTQKMNKLNYYFEGIHYVFTENEIPHRHVNHVNNNRCIGRGMVLDPREPPDNLLLPCRRLLFQPLAVYVEPVGTNLGDLCGDQCPPGCVPVPLGKTFPFKLEIPIPGQFDAKTKKQKTHCSTVSRSGIPLGDAYCVTDYFAQGRHGCFDGAMQITQAWVHSIAC